MPRSLPPRTAQRFGFWIRIVCTVSQPYSLAVLNAPKISMIAAPMLAAVLRTLGT
jgi:hypothetical protein